MYVQVIGTMSATVHTNENDSTPSTAASAVNELCSRDGRRPEASRRPSIRVCVISSGGTPLCSVSSSSGT